MKKVIIRLFFSFLLCFSLICSVCQALSTSSAFVSPLNKDQKAVLNMALGNISIHFRKDSYKENRNQVEKMFSDGVSVLKSIRAHLTLNEEMMFKILRSLDSENIQKEVKALLKDEQDLLASLAKRWNASYSTDDLEKLALISSVSISWDRTMKILKELSPGNGVIYDYSFETAVFVMFLAPEYPGMLYRLWYSKTYSKEMSFYRVCLASALKKCMETITKEQICIAGREAPGKNIIENICLGCLQIISKNRKAKEE